MIEITDLDHLRTSGDFKLDGLLIKKHSFSKQTSGNGRETLSLEAVPYKRMDDGKLLASHDRVYKVVVTDVIEYIYGDRLTDECKEAMTQAYFASEKAAALLLKELGGIDCVWRAPE